MSLFVYDEFELHVQILERSLVSPFNIISFVFKVSDFLLFLNFNFFNPHFHFFLYQIAVHAFTPIVTLGGIFLWNYHPYREAQGLVRERVGNWTILRAVAIPVPDFKVF